MPSTRIRAQKVSHIDRDADTITMPLEIWHEVRKQAKVGHRAMRLLGLGGGCQDFCDDACEGHGGCDFPAGEPGDCIAVCEDGEVFIEV